MKSTILAGVVAALVMVTGLTSGMIDVNLEHHLHLPPELSNKTVITVHKHFLGNTITDIRLDNEIKSENSVKDVVKVLQEAQRGDIIVFHIAGVGGQVETVFDLINNIKTTLAHTIMIVEAPSYSGHAYLAVSGNELIMMPYAYLMFHTSSGYGHDCTKEEGTDRTVSNVEHCTDFMTAHIGLVNSYLDSIDLLTPAEKKWIETGHDVYLSSGEVIKRQAKK